MPPPAPDRRILALGDRAWPFPIPLVKDKSGWRFATEEGEQELINRRIGEGEYGLALAEAVAHINALAARGAVRAEGETASGGILWGGEDPVADGA